MKKAFLLCFQVLLMHSSIHAVEYRFWVGTVSGNWSDIANWSDESGGLGGFSIPSDQEVVVFNEFSIGACSLDVAVNVRGIELTSEFTGKLFHFDKSLTVGEDEFKLLGGEFMGGTGPIRSLNHMKIDGTDFTCTSGTLFIHTRLEIKAGSFNHNMGLVEFSSTDNGLRFSEDLQEQTKLYNVSIQLASTEQLEVLDGDTMWVINRLDLVSGILHHGVVAVEDTAYVHPTWGQGDSELIFVGSGPSFYLLDSGTWSSNDVFIAKENSSDVVTIQEVDNDRVVSLGQDNRELSILRGTLAFQQDLDADFNFEKIHLYPNGHLIASDYMLRISGDYLNHGGWFTHNNGSLRFDGPNESEFISDLVPTEEFFNVFVEKGAGKKLILVEQDTLRVVANLNLIDGLTDKGIFKVEGNVSIENSYDRGTTKLMFAGTQEQEFQLNGLSNNFRADVYLDKPNAGNVILLSAFNMSFNAQQLHLIKGYLITTSENVLTLQKDVTWTGGSDLSFVSGPMKKFGRDPFEFPIGKEGIYAPLYITAPSTDDNSFIAEYFRGDPGAMYDRTQKESLSSEVSELEFWNLEQSSGSSSVKVGLSWAVPRTGDVIETSALGVARWNGSIWKDHQNDGTFVNLPTDNSGTVRTQTALMSYGTFSLWVNPTSSPLPVDFLYFNAENTGEVVKLSWATGAEVNSDNFLVQQSVDGQTWNTIDDVQAAGYSSVQVNYTSVDEHPAEGVNYYRLKQNDFDGMFEYTDIEVIHFRRTDQFNTRVFPNPSTGVFTFEGFSGDFKSLRLFDTSGRELTDALDIKPLTGETAIIDISSVPEGIYLLWSETMSHRIQVE